MSACKQKKQQEASKKQQMEPNFFAFFFNNVVDSYLFLSIVSLAYGTPFFVEEAGLLLAVVK